MNDILMNAIFSMDAYNRGYDPNLKFGNLPDNISLSIGQRIGSATIVLDSSQLLDSNQTPLDQPSDFYALAYEMPNGETTISYRGTNSSLDPFTGYGVSLGVPTGDQAILSFGFYNAVAQASDPFEKITVTGHSL